MKTRTVNHRTEFVILAVIFFALASMFNAMMDNVDHHYYKSVFQKFDNDQYFNPRLSWTNKYVDHDVDKGFIKWKVLGVEFNKPVFLTDFWHLTKSSYIVCICCCIALSLVVRTKYHRKDKITSALLYVCALGFLWNGIFNLFYNHILNIN